MKTQCRIIFPNVIEMIIGVQYFLISPRKITICYKDNTFESRTGKHPFKVYHEGDNTDDFNAFSCTSWIQEIKEKNE